MGEPIGRALVLEAVRVSEAAARAASRYVGRGDEPAADSAAAAAMHGELGLLPISGTVILGEGERDEAPLLWPGEVLGTGGPAVDIGVSALEGKTQAVKALPSALSILVLAEAGSLLAVPDTYMEKIAIGPGYPDGLADLTAEPAALIGELAKAKGVSAAELCCCILDRPRHAHLVEAVRATGAAVRLIADGDVAAIIATADPASGIDLYLGSGGAAEAVLAAAALRCMGGQLQARFAFRSDTERMDAMRLGHADPQRIFALSDLVRGDVIFAATGVTDGRLLAGIRATPRGRVSESVAMHAATATVRTIRTWQRDGH